MSLPAVPPLLPDVDFGCCMETKRDALSFALLDPFVRVRKEGAETKDARGLMKLGFAKVEVVLHNVKSKNVWRLNTRWACLIRRHE